MFKKSPSQLLSNEKIPWLNKLITPIFYLAIILFLIYYFRNLNIEQLLNTQANYLNLFIALALLVVSRFWLAFIWSQILKILQVKDFKYSDLNYVYAKSWLGRYIPGKIAWLLGKIHFASAHGVAKDKLAISAVLEVGLTICVATLAGTIFFFLSDKPFFGQNMQILMGIASLVMLLLLAPPVFNRVIILMFRLLKKENINSTGYNYRSLLLLSAYFFLFCLLSGVSFFFIATSFSDVSASNLSYMISVQNISGVAGILAIFTPSGIGVREGTQLVLLQSTLTDETLIIVLVVARLTCIIADIIFFISSYLWQKLIH